MSKIRTHTVQEVARIAHISVRTLHHYDDIGLLVPDRASNVYRRYTEHDVLRLQQILIHRSFGLPLEAIAKILDAPDFDHQTVLQNQRKDLMARLSETHKMIASIDAALEALSQENKNMTIDLKLLFNGFDPASYEAENAQKWGDTNAYQESTRRTNQYGESEWRAIKTELDLIWSDAAALFKSGTAPDAPLALEVVERHRRHIDHWFYPLDTASHAQLADMWEADPRFQANIDQHADGLTQWVAAAVRAAQR